LAQAVEIPSCQIGRSYPVAMADLRTGLTADARAATSAEEGNAEAMPAEATATRHRERTPCQRARRTCCKYLCVASLFVLVVACLVQALMYYTASMHCSPSKIDKDYAYPGGGKVELVPGNALLIEEETRWWGSHFTVQPSDSGGSAVGASTGAWFRTWGPLFWTYVHRDIQGVDTFMAREQVLAFDASHLIWRCDGTGPTYTISQGTHIIINWLRKLFKSYTSSIYNIWADGTLVAVSSKVGTSGSSMKHLVFKSPTQATPFASAYLQERTYHGHFDKWFITDSEDNSSIPDWVTNAGTVFLAFSAAEDKKNAAPAPAPAPHVANKAEAQVEVETEEEANVEMATTTEASRPSSLPTDSEEATEDAVVQPPVAELLPKAKQVFLAASAEAEEEEAVVPASPQVEEHI